MIGNKSETEILALSPAESDALVLDLMVKLLKRVDPKYEDELDPMKDIGSLKFPYIYNLISKHKGKNTSAATWMPSTLPTTVPVSHPYKFFVT